MKPKGLGRGLSALLPDADEEKALSSQAEIAIKEIKPNPQQPRRDFDRDELKYLANSITEKGILQPLIVREVDAGFELIAGERRLRAAKMAGLAKVPIRVIDVRDDVELLELSLIENLQRDDLNPIELAEGYNNLSKTFGLTQAKIAQRVGRERATVANALRLLDLPLPIKTSLRKGEITAGHAKAILSATGVSRQSAIWKRIIKEGLSVRQTEEAVKQLSNISQSNKSRKARKTEPPEIRRLCDRMRQSLGTQVLIDKRGWKGNIKIEFYSEEDLNRLVDLLSNK